MDREDIQTIIEDIQNAVVSCTKQSELKQIEISYGNKYSDFKKAYPHLFAMACTKNMNMTMLTMMLDMIDKVKKNETTNNDASVVVGQQLFNTFVDPKLDKATKTSLKTNGPTFTFK
jgi:DNA-binding ferritin-like protein (Dps family)